ncbi:hypothetical protein KEM54_006923 [Ascosphaera aggregata]|nr:hypothetical protein KEM54_006923 [Ascosphaera aggregata]
MVSNQRLIAVSEVAQHSQPSDCWVVIHGKVWDVTGFFVDHRGGPEFLACAGHDATGVYSKIYPLEIIDEFFGIERCVGRLDKSTVTDDWLTRPDARHRNPKGTSQGTTKHPPLSSIISTDDFQKAGKEVLSPKAYAFYASAATDVITRDANKSLYNRVWLRPRVLHDVRTVSTKTSMLGHEVSLPLFVSPASMAKLAHPDGECNIAKACESRKLIHGVSNYSSVPLENIIASAPEVSYIFQLYVNKDAARTEEALKRCANNPAIRAIFVTVDAAWPGKREDDERLRVQDDALQQLTKEASGRNDDQGGGIGRLLSGGIDPGLTWETLNWLRSKTKLPLILKGVMSADDAILAMNAKMDGIYVSNHGGRNLDTTPPSILILLELQRRCPVVFDEMEVYVDGGIRRGTDILKALCLGATAVGVGRPALYANAYGQEGVEKLFDILQDELETSMRLVGITSLDQITPDLVNTGDLDHMVPTSGSHPYARRVTRNKRGAVPAKL